MIWAIELGNTRSKRTQFNASGVQLGNTEYFAVDSLEWCAEISPGTVLRIANTAQRSLPESLIPCILTPEHPWPFRREASPTIGMDRCLAVMGVRSLHPKGPVAVISCGTCLTGTLLDADQALRGGPISPGWSMRLQAMSDGAPALPRLAPVEAPFTPSGTTNTESSMQQGAYHGMLAEIRSWIAAWRQEYPDVAIFLTGGDGPAFAKPLESGIFAASNLEALGIFAQYDYEKNL